MLGAVFIAAMVAFCPPQAAPAPTAEEWTEVMRMRLIDADVIIARCETIERNNDLSPTEANRLGWLKEMIQMMPTATDVSVQSLKDEVEELKSENKKLNSALWKLKDALERKDKKLDEYKRAVGGNQNEEHGKRR